MGDANICNQAKARSCGPCCFVMFSTDQSMSTARQHMIACRHIQTHVLISHKTDLPCLTQVQIPNCPNALSAAYLQAVASGNNASLCSEQEINLNGSAVALYNDTSYYDDLTFAATWLYRATGDTDYLSDAEAFYVKHLYGSVSPLLHWQQQLSCVAP